MPRRGGSAALLLVLGLLAAVYAPTLVWLWGRWTLSVWHNAHGLLIPFVVGYFVWLELKAVRSVPSTGSPWGFALLLPALALHVLDTGMHTELLSAVSLVLILPGLSLLFLGVPKTKAIAFPLAFMAFALPIPLAATERIHLALRYIATDATSALVPYLGIPVYAEATTLHLANSQLTIADACSGFSTLYASGAMACLVAYQAEGWKRRLLVLASAAPLAIAANIVRVVILVAVVAWTGVEVLETWVHPASGVLTFVLALPAIFWLGAPSSPPPATSDPAADAPAHPPAPVPSTPPVRTS